MKNRIVLTVISAFFISVSAFSQVGINNTNPTTTLDVNGGISLRESVAPLKINDGVSENIDLGEVPYSQYLIEGPTGAFSIKSIKPISGADGQIVRLINSTAYDMTIVNDKTANPLRILCPNESNLNLKGKNSSVTLQYSKSLRKWTVLGYATIEKQVARKFHAIGKSNIHRQNSSWDTFDELDIEITPSSPLIYLNFNATGRRYLLASAKFRILVNGSPIPGLEIRASNSSEFYNASLPMYPLEVTPGEKIKFSVQWYREGSALSVIYNHPSSDQSHNRYLTIID
ncbi:hypothetical protein [Aequorivita sinensis]|uniref:hypothetical protein n=1 Tax=Aequorivita sinensis TaxID=1382458 RepID=UPI001122F5EE|nr:hypothetical protein [Aequorivita sinensis]